MEHISICQSMDHKKINTLCRDLNSLLFQYIK